MGTLIIDHSAAVDRRGDPFGLASQEPLLYFSSSLNPSPRTGRTTRPSRSFVITKAPSPPPLSSIDLGFSLSSPVIAFHVPSFCSRSIYRWERSRNRREDTISPLSPPFYARLFNLPSRIPPQFLFPRTSRCPRARWTRPAQPDLPCFSIPLLSILFTARSHPKPEPIRLLQSDYSNVPRSRGTIFKSVARSDTVNREKLIRFLSTRCRKDIIQLVIDIPTRRNLHFCSRKSLNWPMLSMLATNDAYGIANPRSRYFHSFNRGICIGIETSLSPEAW